MSQVTAAIVRDVVRTICADNEITIYSSYNDKNKKGRRLKFAECNSAKPSAALDERIKALVKDGLSNYTNITDVVIVPFKKNDDKGNEVVWSIDIIVRFSEEKKVFKVSNEVRSIAAITDVNIGTLGVVTEVCRPNELYEVHFMGGKKRYVYPHEIDLKE